MFACNLFLCSFLVLPPTQAPSVLEEAYVYFDDQSQMEPNFYETSHKTNLTTKKPKTQQMDINFNCTDRPEGYYADVESECRLFHYCRINGVLFTFRCPGDSIFNQKMLSCDNNVTDMQSVCYMASSYYVLNKMIYSKNGQKDMTRRKLYEYITAVATMDNSTTLKKQTEQATSTPQMIKSDSIISPTRYEVSDEDTESTPIKPMHATVSSSKHAEYVTSLPYFDQIDAPDWYHKSPATYQVEESIREWTTNNYDEVETKVPDREIPLSTTTKNRYNHLSDRLSKPKSSKIENITSNTFTTNSPLFNVDWDDESDVNDSVDQWSKEYYPHKTQNIALPQGISQADIQGNDFLYGQPLEFDSMMAAFNPVTIEQILKSLPHYPPMMQMPAVKQPARTQPNHRSNKLKKFIKYPFTLVPFPMFQRAEQSSIKRRWLRKPNLVQRLFGIDNPVGQLNSPLVIPIFGAR